MKTFLVVMFLMPALLFSQNKVEFKPDESISGINLCSPASAVKKIPQLNQLIDSNFNYLDPFPNIRFYNYDSSEILVLILLPGSSQNCFEEFNVSKKTKKEWHGKIFRLSDNYFQTESGIRIGMTKSKLISLKGNSYKTTLKNGIETLEYKIDQEDRNNQILSEFNMPYYYANYSFKSNILIEFEFGFTYP